MYKRYKCSNTLIRDMHSGILVQVYFINIFPVYSSILVIFRILGNSGYQFVKIARNTQDYPKILGGSILRPHGFFFHFTHCLSNGREAVLLGNGSSCKEECFCAKINKYGAKNVVTATCIKNIPPHHHTRCHWKKSC